MKIHYSRRRACAPLDLGSRSYRDNFTLGDGDSFNHRVLRIDGQDLAVNQNQIGRLRRGNPS
jgi:hypothetical protein